MGTLTCVVAPGTTGSRDLWLLRASITCALAPGPPCAPAQVRAGAGGAEAALFAAQLLDFYERAATSKGWEFEVRHLGLQCPPLRVCVCARARMGMRPCTCACKCMHALKFQHCFHQTQQVLCLCGCAAAGGVPFRPWRRAHSQRCCEWLGRVRKDEVRMGGRARYRGCGQER